MSIESVLKDELLHSSEPVYAVCVKSGLNNTSVYKFVNGEATLTLRTADKLADYFGLELTKINHESNK